MLPLEKLDSSQVIQFLNQTIDWYRHAAVVQQTATDPEHLMVLSDSSRIADQIVWLSFDFAKEKAEEISKGTPPRTKARVRCTLQGTRSY